MTIVFLLLLKYKIWVFLPPLDKIELPCDLNVHILNNTIDYTTCLVCCCFIITYCGCSYHCSSVSVVMICMCQNGQWWVVFWLPEGAALISSSNSSWWRRMGFYRLVSVHCAISTFSSSQFRFSQRSSSISFVERLIRNTFPGRCPNDVCFPPSILVIMTGGGPKANSSAKNK